MLWNWYDKGLCMLSSSWDTSTKSKFGGSCVGLFAILLFMAWWKRLMFEYKNALSSQRSKEVRKKIKDGKEFAITRKAHKYASLPPAKSQWEDFKRPLLDTLKFDWFWALDADNAVNVGSKQVTVYPTIFDHILYCAADAIEWSLHHVVMLLFMYFNGYIVISCWIGAVVGYFLFNYKPSKRVQAVSGQPATCCA